MAHYYTRRRENLVDLAFDPDPLSASGTDGWRIKHASNWDGTFSQLVDIPYWGKRDKNVLNSYNPSNIQDRYVRYIFDPVTHGLEDDTVHFLRITSLDDTTEQNTSRTLIIPTPSQVTTERPPLVLRGDAPVAADFDDGERLVLPVTAVSFTVENFGTDDIFLGFGSEGSELRVAGGEKQSDNRLQIDEVNLRTGSGTASEVQLYLVLAQGPSI